ncbi:hypothetical protein DsansV1_C03g0027271 [Dioscorea sansibarensis]
MEECGFYLQYLREVYLIDTAFFEATETIGSCIHACKDPSLTCTEEDHLRFTITKRVNGSFQLGVKPQCPNCKDDTRNFMCIVELVLFHLLIEAPEEALASEYLSHRIMNYMVPQCPPSCSLARRTLERTPLMINNRMQ